ncbi:MAG: hypothetical protein HY234_02785 [Acidobacteria bacterium]|nr:hypothetical protein [Acidobacteriota bacterium]MBI3661961.1 hypothetical protein [Acidobacteriota bacterium]
MRFPGRFVLGLVVMCFVLFAATTFHAGSAAAQTKSDDAPFVVEYYYKVKWGYAGEFIRLFKKNHFPLLQKEMEAGRILQVTAVAPRYHGTEDDRWDYRVTIVYKNVAAAHETPNRDSWLRQLYPDRDAFDKEEQRRFEILLAHWDLPIVPVPL